MGHFKLSRVVIITSTLLFCSCFFLVLQSANHHGDNLMRKPQIVLNSLYNLSYGIVQREDRTQLSISNLKENMKKGTSSRLDHALKEDKKDVTWTERMKEKLKNDQKIGSAGSESHTKESWTPKTNLLPPGVTWQEFRTFFQQQGEDGVKSRMRVKEVCELYQEGVLDDPPNAASYSRIYQHLLHHPRYRLVYCPVWKMDQEEEDTTTNEVNTSSEHQTSDRLSKHNEMSGSVKREARGRFQLPLKKKRARGVIRDSRCVVMIVRHPLQRLVSAYRDKMMARNSTVRDYLYLRTIIKHRYRSITNSNNAASTTTTSPSFSEFVDFVLDEWRSSDPRPATWREWSRDWHPIYYLCHPCLINYTHILRYETYNMDLKEFRQQCKLEGVRLEGTHHHQLGNTSSSQVEQDLYGQLTHSQILQLAQVYFIDLVMFGYNVTKYLQFARPD
ncbi:carbohydrate sulfotransferase 11-like isoform X2 [Homarus americanus]|uniref:carbohydrate sulfotransferase 11-like isoform X2 n=1 Tax=Homarus americanus TaxID=6706 RepID=UPI001C485D39|nr:carbohydrate sulfotransferase 11-like isoform X2 [Homarus americanus]